MREQYPTSLEEKMAPKADLLPVPTKLSITYVGAGKLLAETFAAERAFMDPTTNTFKVVNKVGMVVAEFEREVFVVCKVAEVK